MKMGMAELGLKQPRKGKINLFWKIPAFSLR